MDDRRSPHGQQRSLQDYKHTLRLLKSFNTYIFEVCAYLIPITSLQYNYIIIFIIIIIIIIITIIISYNNNCYNNCSGVYGC